MAAPSDDGSCAGSIPAWTLHFQLSSVAERGTLQELELVGTCGVIVSATSAHGRIAKVGDLLSQVSDIREVWFPEEVIGPWYRGQARAEWGLRPSLYRSRVSYEEIRKERIEDEIREEFIVRAPVLSESKPAGDDDWEWYFLMQHYGAPTRLLDWTEGALLALYFAVKDNCGHFDAAVWVLDPYGLNSRAIGIGEVIPPSAQGVSRQDKRRVGRWLPTRFRGNSIPSKPIAVFPTHIARRISTQRSCFTVHGRDFRGLERLEGSRRPLLRRLIVPSYCVREIKRELIDGGIDEATIFPDLDGLGRAVGAKYTDYEVRLPHMQVLTELRPSKVYPGEVGVFALSRIRKNARPFRGENEEIVWFDEKLIVKERLSKHARKLYEDFSLRRDGRLGCPTSFNRLTVAWYLKEARKGTKPNVRPNEFYEFRALRDIAPGEELIAEFSPK